MQRFASGTIESAAQRKARLTGGEDADRGEPVRRRELRLDALLFGDIARDGHEAVHVVVAVTHGHAHVEVDDPVAAIERAFVDRIPLARLAEVHFRHQIRLAVDLDLQSLAKIASPVRCHWSTSPYLIL